jgi:hypothetical protein
MVIEFVDAKPCNLTAVPTLERKMLTPSLEGCLLGYGGSSFLPNVRSYLPNYTVDRNTRKVKKF